MDGEMKRWSAGDTVVVRNIARSDGTVTMAMSTICIQDDQQVLALFVPAGTIAKDNYVVAPADRATYVRSAPPSRDRVHQDRTWTAPSIRLYLSGEAFSTWLFFNSENEFTGWYGNLESPYLRTPIGIDTSDHALDVVADPKRRWRWKDEAEFAQRLAIGLDTPAHQAAVRAAGLEFIGRLERSLAPFDQDWPAWRSPPEWRARQLPRGWNLHFGLDATST